jgi:hypothetical protein
VSPPTRRTVLSLLASSCAASWAPAAQGLHEEDASLFNGRDLTGWDTYLGKPHVTTDMPGLTRHRDGAYAEVVGLNRDPRGVFSVVEIDGAPAIRISGETYGALITQAEYDNYHLRFQFRWGTRRWPPRPEAPRDTGCCYHSVGPHGASYGFWMRSFEFQIQEADVGDFYSLAGVIVDVTATATDPADPKSDLRYVPTAPKVVGTTRRVIKAATAERPLGQWNTVDLYCLGQTSVHVVNGRTMVVLTGLRHNTGAGEAPLTRGKLQLQSEAAEVYYRAITIRPIREIPREVFARAQGSGRLWALGSGLRAQSAFRTEA